MEPRLVWSVALVILGLSVSCAPPLATRPLIAIFPVDIREVKLNARQAKLMQDHLVAVLDETGSYRTISGRALFRPKGKGRHLRSCREPSCQVELSRRVSANKALSISVVQNVMSQCEVIGALYDLGQTPEDHRARSLSSCVQDELVDSLNKVLCYMLSKGAASTTVTAEVSPMAQAECLTLAALLRVEERLAAFRQITLGGGRRTLTEQERDLAEQVLSLKGAYQTLGQGKTDRWSVSSICRIGAAYEQYARILSGAVDQSIPHAIAQRGDQAVQDYQQELTEALKVKVQPVKEQAKKQYHTCVQRAGELDLETRFIQEAREHLKQL
jgi:hypothetical protein